MTNINLRDNEGIIITITITKKQTIKTESDILGNWLKTNYIKDQSGGKIPTISILNDFKAYMNKNHKGEKGHNQSAQSIGRKIADIFKINSSREWQKIGGNRINTTVYPIKKI
jgi:hypothetical protein